MSRICRSGAAALIVFALVLLATAPCHAQRKRGPFTQSPRSVRSRNFDQQHLRLELRLDWSACTIDGRAIHTLTPFRPAKSLELDAKEMTIQRVVLQGEDKTPVKFVHHDGKLRIDLDREHQPGESFQMAIDYRVKAPRNGAHFVVPDEDEPNQSRMLWTQSEPEYARYWHPCLDSPTDRLTSETVVTVPEDCFVLSNGVLEGKRLHEDGTQTWHWRQKQSHVPYLISVVAGQFEAYEQSWQGIPIISYVPVGRLADAPRSFEKTPAMMALFTDLIGVRYPWPKYAQICVDEYHWGGMEHTSATTLNLNTLHDERAHLDKSSDNLVAHELAHQWFGNLLTCKDWGELWLNESFATYFATLWTEHDQGWEEAVWARHKEMKSYLDEDRKRYRRPIVSYRYQRPGQMFDRHSYPKGARVLHMLRQELGDDLFWRAIHRYTTVNRFRTVETANLRIAIEDATGQGMNWFFDQWIYHGGHPEFEVDWQWDERAKMARVTVKQTQKQDDLTPLFRVGVEIALSTPQETVKRRVTLSAAEETFHFDMKQRPTRVCFDPDDWILKELKFPKSKQELIDQLAHDEHVMCRIRAAQGLADLKEHEDAQAALEETAKNDDFWAVRLEAVKALSKFRGENVRTVLIHVAQNDPRSEVRREAIKACASFKHDDTTIALSKIIFGDPSYYAVAEALKTLAKIAPKEAEEPLLAALEQPSHDEVILKAAIDGLVQIKSSAAESRLQDLLAANPSPQRRLAVVTGLVKFKSDDPAALELLHEQLESDRYRIRRGAIEALEKIGGAESIDVLLEQRKTEDDVRLVEKIDQAVEKLREKNTDLDGLRKELQRLQEQNRRLEQRLKSLERQAN